MLYRMLYGIISLIFMTVTNSVEIIGLASEVTVTLYMFKGITIYFKHTKMNV